MPNYLPQTPDNFPKPAWKTGKTCVIRVPVALKEELLAIAHKLDEQHANNQN